MPNGHDRELLQCAARLGKEADAVIADLGVRELFATVGRPIHVGSTSFGLALSRDIDLDTLCPSLDPGSVWDSLRPLAQHPRVRKLRWTDQRGRFNATGEPHHEGIYCGVRYIPDGASLEAFWKLDCWFLPADAPRPDIATRDRLLAATSEERLAILRIKDEAIRASRYGPTSELQGIHIYEAVLDRGVRTYAELARLRPG